ncbi:hypothetical protein HOD38_00515 [archaeon]|nr:hypothetical protein [archaeon]MBT4396729.1 hypothetical protein [archaeon]MBT4441339.1 hypothetical protein [archaeon]
MELVYIQQTPFGEFYFDPVSCEGISLNHPPTIIGMNSEWDPYSMRTAQRIEVTDDAFDIMKEAHNKGETHLRQVIARCLAQDLQ